MASDLVVTWNMSCTANQFLLGKLTAKHLAARYSARTRTVAGQFVHMHNVRVRWMKLSTPDLASKLESFERGAEPTRAQLKKALKASAKVVAKYLDVCEKVGQVKHWDGPTASYLGYLVAHEAHHRGLAMVALRVADLKLDDEVIYGQWQWGKKTSQPKD